MDPTKLDLSRLIAVSARNCCSVVAFVTSSSPVCEGSHARRCVAVTGKICLCAIWQRVRRPGGMSRVRARMRTPPAYS
eukprot:3282073-Lingulodinium_polyedra.AAC.1